MERMAKFLSVLPRPLAAIAGAASQLSFLPDEVKPCRVTFVLKQTGKILTDYNGRASLHIICCHP